MNQRLYDYNKRCQTGNGYPDETMYYIKDKDGIYYNVEYNVENSMYLDEVVFKELAKPVSEPLAKSFVDDNVALRMEEVI